MKNIFELAQEEKEAKQYRINQVLCGGMPRGSSPDVRAFIAQGLYNAKYDGNTHEEAEDMTADAILENFCWNIFGADFEEVIKAWDKYLG